MDKIQTSVSSIKIKGVKVSYVAEYCQAKDGAEYTTTEQDKRNLNRAINTYWKKLDMPENVVSDLNSDPKFP